MFASFDALVGYKEVVSETARRVDGRIELIEGELEELNRRLAIIINTMEENTDNGEMPSSIIRSDSSSPTVSIIYFVPDSVSNPGSLKDGGSYVTVTGAVWKIDLYQRLLFFSDRKAVSIDDVVKLDGDIFTEYE